MGEAGFRIVPAAEARRLLTDGDVRSDIAFQNDVNLLLASLEEICDLSTSSSKPRSGSGGSTAEAPRRLDRVFDDLSAGFSSSSATILIKSVVQGWGGR